jgi:Transglutaminase-like enzymes, putative cysteine proteases
MVKYSGSSKIKVLVYFNGGSSYYQYNIAGNGSYVTLPLQSGSGSYRVRFMENVSGSSYAELCSTELNASVTGSGYTLYPNQYADYTLSSAAVAKAKSLCANAPDNARKVDLIYRYVISTIKYDYPKASSVQSGYLPNVDSTLSTKKGICFDYAALMAAMCRSQGIPTKLVIGDTSVGYHAWNEIYVGGWKRYDATFAAAGQTAGTYTPQKYY